MRQWGALTGLQQTRRLFVSSVEVVFCSSPEAIRRRAFCSTFPRKDFGRRSRLTAVTGTPLPLTSVSGGDEGSDFNV